MLGTCNGFQVLVRSRSLPGRSCEIVRLRFVCDMVATRVEVERLAICARLPERGATPPAGCAWRRLFFADAETLRELNANRQVILRYADSRRPDVVPEANPNWFDRNIIAGICNRERNVFGLMPHS